MERVQTGENCVSSQKKTQWSGKWRIESEETFRKVLLRSSPKFTDGSFVFRPLQNIAPLYMDIDLEFDDEPEYPPEVWGTSRNVR